jgi:hypothetical protein
MHLRFGGHALTWRVEIIFNETLQRTLEAGWPLQEAKRWANHPPNQGG